MRKIPLVLSIFLTGSLVSASAVLLGYQKSVPITPEEAHAATPSIKGLVENDEPAWAAAAPGRIEPKGSEIRISPPMAAVIREVLVQLNDRVKTGDILVHLDDDELRARLRAASALAAARLNQRDAVEVRGLALDRRKAEDALYAAERNAFDARLNLDHLISQLKSNKASQEDVEKERVAVASAKDKVEQERANLKRVQTSDKMPPLKAEEASLAAARADVAIASTMLERTRIRAPVDATVLDLNAKLGETAGSAGDTPLLVLGDTAHLQIRAEVEERDVRKIYPGQAAVVRSDAFPGRSFDAHVSTVAKALGAPQISAQGPRKPSDVDVLEVKLDLDDGTPLLPGMRADVFFKESDSMAKNTASNSP
jgi:HlyD family secretion protein